MNKNKGFTLIELLVVIAIIGILSSVVLASLNNARTKAKDAAVKSQLASMRAQAELYYNSQSTPTYLGVCAATAANSGLAGLLSATVSGTAIPSTLTAIASPNGNVAGTYNTVTCHDTATGWAAEAPMSTSISGTPAMYCVDYTSNSANDPTILAVSAITC